MSIMALRLTLLHDKLNSLWVRGGVSDVNDISPPTAYDSYQAPESDNVFQHMGENVPKDPRTRDLTREEVENILLSDPMGGMVWGARDRKFEMTVSQAMKRENISMDPRVREALLTLDMMKQSKPKDSANNVISGTNPGKSALYEYLKPQWKPERIAPEKPIIIGITEQKLVAHYVRISVKHKLLISTIPKVGCTEFMKLINRMNNRSDWNYPPHFQKDYPALSKLSPKRATQIMNDPTWTKAVFFRDPAERLLSAYIDKFLRNHKYSIVVFKDWGKTLTFEEFVDKVTACIGDAECLEYQKRALNGTVDKQHTLPKEGLHSWTNQHWRPQIHTTNLDQFLHVHDFVGNFSHLHMHTYELLSGLGLWEKYGASGWGKNKNEAVFDRNAARHRTAAGADFKFKAYYTPELLAKVKEAYRMDYAVFDLIGAGKSIHPVSGEKFKSLPEIDPRYERKWYPGGTSGIEKNRARM